MTSVVYFAECSATGRIKIGRSDDITRRLWQLNNGNCAPIRLVGAMSGGALIERHIHQMFQESRLHGEWFASCSAIWALIERVNHGTFSFECVFVPKRIVGADFSQALVTAAEKMRLIGSAAGHKKTKQQISHAAEQTGLGYWRSFDLWYRKARQILPAEESLISDALERCQLLTVEFG